VEKGKEYRILVGKSLRKYPVGRQADNKVTINIKKTQWGNMKWAEVAHDNVQHIFEGR
jgi:hypothetical protein